MSNLLVTGGAGFIGSHFVLRHAALHPQDRIVVLDALRMGSDRSYLDPLGERITFVKGDIADLDLVSKVLLEQDIDTIVNFAAETHVDRSIQSAIPFIHSNIVGVQCLIEILRAKPSLRMLHISTDEVYGDIENDDRARTVEDPLIPSSPYAASKASGDLLLIAAMRTYDINVCIVRPANNYGPHQAAEKFIPTVIRRALADQPIPIYGTGKNRREWLFVEDHCDALEVLLATDWVFKDEKTGSGHLFNISSGEEKENLDVARTVLRLLGKPESLLTFVNDRPGHDWRYATNAEAIRALGWAPETTFDDGILRTIDWYKSQAEAVD